MPYLSMSYPCHKFVPWQVPSQVVLSRFRPEMKFLISRKFKLHCCSSSAYHCTAFIKHTVHTKIYLLSPRARTPLLPAAFKLGGDAAGAGSCAPADPSAAAAAGSVGAGAAGAGVH